MDATEAFLEGSGACRGVEVAEESSAGACQAILGAVVSRVDGVEGFAVVVGARLHDLEQALVGQEVRRVAAKHFGQFEGLERLRHPQRHRARFAAGGHGRRRRRRRGHG
mmetsp:Transcript_49677/g.55352  ORF Transcript_49677/g.55352 Transcript_49677/m.55352 type:complete len:109 (-) Transcript_49677:251-577(-)